MRRARGVACLAVSVWLAAGCATPDLDQLKRLQEARSVEQRQAAARESIHCNTESATCARLHLEQAGICLSLATSGDAAQRATMRDCALRGFRQAGSLAPANAATADRLNAQVGLSSTLQLQRDASAAAAARAANDELFGAGAALAKMPGGAAHGAYFTADAELFRVLSGEVAQDRQCVALQAASARTADVATSDAALSERLVRIRRLIDDARRSPARNCP